MFLERHLLILGTFLLALLLYVDRIAIAAAKDGITGDLGLTDKEFGWVLSAFALGYALFQTPGGWLADRFGPRRVLAAVVVVWSLFTGLTGWMRSYAAMLVVRFLFGAGEAGGFPGMARAVYSWVPMDERGLATGVNFSGGRIGGALALALLPWMIEALGWRGMFHVLMAAGLVWAAAWYAWFRDEPEGHPRIGRKELDHILLRRQPRPARASRLPLGAMLGSANLWLAMAQYFASNFTFFFMLSWLFPYLKETYRLDPVTAGWYSASTFLAGACGNVASGRIMDRIYRAGRWRLSRQLPAMAGFALAAAGVFIAAQTASVGWAVLWLSVAVFGADMTLAPSWAFSTDIGREHAGAACGTMNMAGNLGSFVTTLAFPYLLDWTGSHAAFFHVAALLNVLAALLWLGARPERPLACAPASG
jgi:ACS family glucarate transporter-like MFS transporter